MEEERYIENESTPTTQSTSPQSSAPFSKEKVSAGAEKVKNRLKGKLNRKALVTIGLALVILIGAIVGIRCATNNYMTPIRNMQKTANQHTANYRKALQTDIRNLGVSSGHMNDVVKILRKSDTFLDMNDSVSEFYEELYESRQDKYGDNFKITYTVEDKIKLEKSDLLDCQESYHQDMESAEGFVDAAEYFDDDDWVDFADGLGLTSAQAKKLVPALKKALKDIGRVEVTNGYELDIVKTITGDALDEPKEDSMTIRVVKVNGRWIRDDGFNPYSLIGSY